MKLAYFSMFFMVILVIFISGCTQQPPAAPTCKPDWKCADWSSCDSEGSQTTTCTDLNKCNATEIRKTVYQSCTPICNENWQCTDWSKCSNYTQTRNCTDKNKCGTLLNKPQETTTCAINYTANLTREDNAYRIVASDVKAEKINDKLNLMVFFTITNVGTLMGAYQIGYGDTVLDNMGGQYEMPDHGTSLRFDNPSIIEDGDIYPGVTKSGWVQFPPLPLEAKHITLIESFWSDIPPNGRTYKFDFYLE